ncbi:MAG: DUF5050 domain-containing protein [Clostridiales bacterium]|nr:DUF5050 domain-containing protein [Clostridiales bacterium]
MNLKYCIVIFIVAIMLCSCAVTVDEKAENVEDVEENVNEQVVNLNLSESKMSNVTEIVQNSESNINEGYNISIEPMDPNTQICNRINFGQIVEGDKIYLSVLHEKKVDNEGELKYSGGIYSLSPNKIELISDQYARFLTIYKEKIYFATYYENGLYRMNLDGTSMEKLDIGMIIDIYISDDILYYSDYPGDAALKLINLSNNTKGNMLNSLSYNIIIKDEYLYYINDDDFSIYQYNISNNITERLISETASKFCVVKDDIYFFSSSLKRFNIASQELTTLNKSLVGSFVINGNWIYYVALPDKERGLEKAKLYRIPLDGTENDKEILLNDLEFDVYDTFLYIAKDTIYITTPYDSSEYLAYNTLENEITIITYDSLLKMAN